MADGGPGGQRALAWQSLEGHASATQGSVVGGLQINLEKLENRPHQTLGLSQGLAKYQAQHQAGLDGLIRIDGLPAWCAARLGWPELHRLLLWPLIGASGGINAANVG